MSCHHRYWHGCDWPPPPEWYDPYAYPARRRRYPDEVTAETLQARAEALRDELERIERDLQRLSATPDAEAGT